MYLSKRLNVMLAILRIETGKYINVEEVQNASGRIK